MNPWRRAALVVGLVAACTGERPAPDDASLRRDAAIEASAPDVAAPDAPTVSEGAVEAPTPAHDPARAVALRTWTPVRREPRRDAELAGYLRAGAVVDIESGPWGDDGCARARDAEGGWFRVTGGGFLCVGGDNAAMHPSRDVRPLSPPDLDAPLPFRYATVVGRTNLYRRVPTEADLRRYEPWRFGAVAPNAPRPRLDELVGDATGPLIRRALSGMYVALDRVVRDTSRGERYWRTQSGGLVLDTHLGEVRHASAFEGVTVDDAHPLPLAWMISETGWSYAVTPDGRLSRETSIARLSPVALASDDPFTVGPLACLHTTDGHAVLADAVRVARLREPPEGVGEGERWIDVDLDEQVLVAYEGARPVFATLISSGRRSARGDDAGFETPAGTYRVQSKHVSATMDGDTASDGPYSIEDVPWVMYFQGSYALHAAFWHGYFGWRMSHGCVNLSPSDARRMFFWSEPRLPPGWHGAYADPSHPGTRVEIRHSHGGRDLAAPRR